MNLPIRRHFVTLGNRQIHYRRAGQGSPVLLLHQSPTSSREYEPLMRRLAQSHTVFAPDMPGYGASDPLPEAQLSMELLADNTAAFMDAVGIEIAGVYGFHTGASLGNALARRHPQRVCVSVLVGLLCLTETERQVMLNDYLPEFLPLWDGGHLAWLWSRIKDQSVFFPWYERTAAARVRMDGASPEGVQANLPDWLRTGQRYRSAYEASFRYRPETDLPFITTPHFIMTYEFDPLFQHLDRLPSALPGLEIIRCSTAADAQTLACDLLGRHRSVGAAPPVTASRPMPARPWQDYLTAGGAQLRVLRAGPSAGRPVLVQHGAQSSLGSWTGLVNALATRQPVFAIELPGHGESDPMPDVAEPSVADVSTLILDAAQVLGISELDLVGLEAGAAIQAEFAARALVPAHSVSMIGGLHLTDSSLRQAMLDSYREAATDFFGGHLLRAWHMARDHLLFFPWYERRRDCAALGDPRVDPAFVHQAFADTVFAGASGFAMRRAEARYPLVERVARLSCPVTFAAPRSSPRFLHTQGIAAGYHFSELPHEVQHWISRLSCKP